MKHFYPLLTLLMTFALAVSHSGCGIGTTIGCDFRKGSVNGPEPRCQERSGVQGGKTFEAACKALEGDALEGGCPQDGVVLGCEISDGVIDWYYAPKTAEEIQTECETEGGTVITTG